MLELFVNGLDPIVEDNIEDLQQKIIRFSSIKVKGNDKIAINVQKKISGLEKRLKCYALF